MKMDRQPHKWINYLRLEQKTIVRNFEFPKPSCTRDFVSPVLQIIAMKSRFLT